jgi:FKBP-type peptidyl-prolyl cis-trans isomerase FkpA
MIYLREFILQSLKQMIRMRYLAILICLLVLSASSCKKDKEEECTATAGTTVAPASEEQVVTKYIQDSSIANTLEFENTGMYYVVSQQGNTKRAAQCSIVTVKYVGKLANGYVFDKTADGASARFTLGGLIEGWKRILPTVGEGAKLKLFIPPSLAYGPNNRENPLTGAISIPGNSMLIFDIELEKIE